MHIKEKTIAKPKCSVCNRIFRKNDWCISTLKKRKPLILCKNCYHNEKN